MDAGRAPNTEASLRAGPCSGGTRGQGPGAAGPARLSPQSPRRRPGRLLEFGPELHRSPHGPGRVAQVSSQGSPAGGMKCRLRCAWHSHPDRDNGPREKMINGPGRSAGGAALWAPGPGQWRHGGARDPELTVGHPAWAGSRGPGQAVGSVSPTFLASDAGLPIWTSRAPSAGTGPPRLQPAGPAQASLQDRGRPGRGPGWGKGSTGCEGVLRLRVGTGRRERRGPEGGS